MGGGESGDSCEKRTVMINQQHHHVEVETSGSASVINEDDKCNGREKTLSLLVILLSVFSFGLLVFISVSGPLSSLLAPDPPPGSQTLGICDSPQCVDISYHALHAGNFVDNPCQNFYRYSCSKWQAENPVTTEQFFHAANINLIKDRVDLRFKELLEVPNTTGPRQRGRRGAKVAKNVKAFYQSCLNFVNLDEKHLISELVKSAGGYQRSDTWSEDDFDLTNATLKFLLMNAAPLFDVMLDIDVKNRSRFAIIIDLPRPTSLVPSLLFRGPDQDHEYLLVGNWMHRHKYHDNGSDRFKFRHHVNNSSASPSVIERHLLYKMITDNIESKRLNQLKGLVRKVCSMANVSEEECTADINDISGIVETIQKAFLPRQRTRKVLKQQNLVYNSFTMETLESHLTGIDWKHLLGTLVGAKKDKADNSAIKWNQVLGTVYVSYPDYLRRLLTFIQFTNKRVLYNAMLMIYVRDVLNDLVDSRKIGNGESPETPEPTKSEKEYSSSSNEPLNADEPRWKFCVQSTKSVFAMELSSLYLHSFEPAYLQSVRSDVEGIFRMVKESLKSFLNRSTWLDSRARVNALRKIETLKGNFLAPSFYFREDYLDDSIKNIQIDADNFMANVLLVYKVFREQLYRTFSTKIDEDRVTWSFVTFPFVVNAFYIQQFNSIVIPLGFLSPPQYRLGAPKYINYATIALTIAHEALHALDGSGRDFNENGQLEKWISETRGFLREKSACVANQYSETFKSEIYFHQTKVMSQVDGNLTQNENMADIAGLQVAYNAYQTLRNSVDKETREQMERKLPGINFSLDQVFFISVAQAYCANISPMGYVILLEMDEHTPHPERINGMMMNIPEFAKAFQCPLGSPMNPKHKCSLW